MPNRIAGVALTLELLLFALVPTSADAAVYFIGAFGGAVPSDDADCGTGLGSAPDPHPCLTLEHWNRERRGVLQEGDAVHLAPGLYIPAADTGYHCIIMQRGVTYEGRTALDEPASDLGAVVIDGQRTEDAGICYARGVTCAAASGCDASGFTLRAVTLRNGAKQGIKHDVPAGETSAGILIERVRLVNFGRQGINISDQPSDIDCQTNGRRVRDITIRDSIIERNHGVFGGVAMNCIDGFTFEGNIVRNNLPRGCTWESCASGACDCNDHDGVQLAGAINGTLRGNKVYNCGEDCVDLGGHWNKTYNITVEGNWVADGATRWAKLSSGVRDVTLRNNIFSGHGTFEIATCEERIRVHNNTFWRTDDGLVFKVWTRCKDCEFTNNVIRGALTSTDGRVVTLSRAATSPDVVWRANVIVNAGSTGALLREDQGAGSCDPCSCSGVCDPPEWCPVPWPDAQAVTILGNDDLESFRAQGDAGDWLGAESGDTDIWAAEPLVIDPSGMTPAGLHLTEADAVARDRGIDLSGAVACTNGSCTGNGAPVACAFDVDCVHLDDYDLEARFSPWDIGADEFGPLPPTTTLPVFPTTTIPAPPSDPCGDGFCAGSAAGEDCFSCALDCRCSGKNCTRVCCGDGLCGERENADQCPVDCAAPSTTLPPTPTTTLAVSTTTLAAPTTTLLPTTTTLPAPTTTLLPTTTTLPAPTTTLPAPTTTLLPPTTTLLAPTTTLLPPTTTLAAPTTTLLPPTSTLPVPTTTLLPPTTTLPAPTTTLLPPTTTLPVPTTTTLPAPTTTLPDDEPVCGDGICAGGSEDCQSCRVDCRCRGRDCRNACCGDGVCTHPENSRKCPVDCP